MKKLAIAVSILAFSALSASAADLPAQMYTKAPMVTGSNWTGLYIGGEVGWMRGQFDGDFLTPPPASFGSSSSNGAAGGFIGAQYQFHNGFVLGVEANVVGLFKRSLGGGACNPAASCGPGALRTVSLDPIWSGGLRFGWAMGQWMPYATGGFAGTRMSLVGTDATPLNESDTQNRFGYYIGAGVDWMLTPNWILGAEYRHYDFGTDVNVPFDNLIGAAAVGDSTNIKLKADSAMLRLSYKYDGR